MLFAIIFGLFMGLIVDRIWWEFKLDKYEKGLEAHEHYHFSLESIIAYLLIKGLLGFDLIPILGFATALFIAEWAQIGYWQNSHWEHSHPFAYGSVHFIASTIITIILLTIILISMLVL